MIHFETSCYNGGGQFCLLQQAMIPQRGIHAVCGGIWMDRGEDCRREMQELGYFFQEEFLEKLSRHGGDYGPEQWKGPVFTGGRGMLCLLAAGDQALLFRRGEGSELMACQPVKVFGRSTCRELETDQGFRLQLGDVILLGARRLLGGGPSGTTHGKARTDLAQALSMDQFRGQTQGQAQVREKRMEQTLRELTEYGGAAEAASILVHVGSE